MNGPKTPAQLLPAAEAFNAGADLWVIKNDSNNPWWQEIDFRSGFLLSKCLYHRKKPVASKLLEILEMTELKQLEFSEDPNLLLIGSADHFLNKWILIWNQMTPNFTEKLEQLVGAQKANSVRFFSDDAALIDALKARPKTSLDNITFVENR